MPVGELSKENWLARESSKERYARSERAQPMSEICFGFAQAVIMVLALLSGTLR